MGEDFPSMLRNTKALLQEVQARKRNAAGIMFAQLLYTGVQKQLRWCQHSSHWLRDGKLSALHKKQIISIASMKHVGILSQSLSIDLRSPTVFHSKVKYRFWLWPKNVHLFCEIYKKKAKLKNSIIRIIEDIHF